MQQLIALCNNLLVVLAQKSPCTEALRPGKCQPVPVLSFLCLIRHVRQNVQEHPATLTRAKIFRTNILHMSELDIDSFMVFCSGHSLLIFPGHNTPGRQGVDEQ